MAIVPNNIIKDRFKGWTVLVVDDEPDSLEVASRWLHLAGARVVRGMNGQAGLEMARVHKPNFIIADLTMPVMDGWEMLYEIKNDPMIAHTPVIALTAHALKSIEDQALAAGFIAHIPKPLSPTKFIEQVLNIIVEVPALAEKLDTPLMI